MTLAGHVSRTNWSAILHVRVKAKQDAIRAVAQNL
jgi:hypothetical protein